MPSTRKKTIKPHVPCRPETASPPTTRLQSVGNKSESSAPSEQTKPRQTGVGEACPAGGARASVWGDSETLRGDPPPQSTPPRRPQRPPVKHVDPPHVRGGAFSPHTPGRARHSAPSPTCDLCECGNRRCHDPLPRPRRRASAAFAPPGGPDTNADGGAEHRPAATVGRGRRCTPTWSVRAARACTAPARSAARVVAHTTPPPVSHGAHRGGVRAARLPVAAARCTRSPPPPPLPPPRRAHPTARASVGGRRRASPPSVPLHTRKTLRLRRRPATSGGRAPPARLRRRHGPAGARPPVDAGIPL